MHLAFFPNFEPWLTGIRNWRSPYLTVFTVYSKVTWHLLCSFEIPSIGCNAFLASCFHIQNCSVKLVMFPLSSSSVLGFGVYTLDLSRPYTQKTSGYNSISKQSIQITYVTIWCMARAPSYAQYKPSSVPPLVSLRKGNTLYCRCVWYNSPFIFWFSNILKPNSPSALTPQKTITLGEFLLSTKKWSGLPPFTGSS